MGWNPHGGPRTPTAPIISLDASADWGTSNSDRKTNDLLPKFNVILNPIDVVDGSGNTTNAIINILRGGSSIFTHKITNADIANGYSINTGQTQPQGTNVYTATITVAGQTSGASNSLSILFDASLNAPSTIAVAPQSQTGSVSTNTSQTKPYIRVTLPAGIVSGDAVCLASSTGTPTLTSATLTGTDITNGYADVQYPTDLALGSHSLLACFQHTAAAATAFSPNSSVFTFAVVAKPTMTYLPVTYGQNGVAYTGATPSMTAGVAPFVYTIHAGSIPTNTTVSSSTGVISGTPNTTADNTGIVLRSTDANGEFADTPAFHINILAVAFTPANLATAIGWWDSSNAGSITSSLGLVSQQNDLIGTNHLTSSGANRPTTGSLTVNALNTISVLDSQNNIFLRKSFAGGAFPIIKGTIYVVAQIDAINSSDEYLFFMGNLGAPEIGLASNDATNFKAKVSCAGVGAASFGGAANQNGLHVFRLNWDSAGSGPIDLYIDGVANANTTGFTTLPATPYLAFLQNHFNAANGSYRFCESILCNAPPSAGDENYFYKSYLDPKWGATA